MKKVLLSFAALIFIIVESNAQGISAGVKLGGLSHGVSFDETEDGEEFGRSFGYQVGGFFAIKTPVKFGGKVEVLFSGNRGYNNEFSETETFGNQTITVDSKSEIRFNTLDIPIMGTFNIVGPLSIEAGPQLSYWMSGSFSNEATANGVTTTNDGDIESNDIDEKTNLGFVVGASVDLPVKVGAFLRYNHQLGVFDEDVDGSFNWVSFGVTYSFL